MRSHRAREPVSEGLLDAKTDQRLATEGDAERAMIAPVMGRAHVEAGVRQPVHGRRVLRLEGRRRLADVVHRDDEHEPRQRVFLARPERPEQPSPGRGGQYLAQHDFGHDGHVDDVTEQWVSRAGRALSGRAFPQSAHSGRPCVAST